MESKEHLTELEYTHQQGCPLCSATCVIAVTPAQVATIDNATSAANNQLWHVETRKALHGRMFIRCANCALVFVPSQQHLTNIEEKAHYDLHDNNPEDLGYRRFLSRAAEPVTRLMAKGSNGLDFGSGPGPTLSLMLNEAGMHCADYDLYYANHPELLRQQYDFITSTEVFEHLANPRAVLDQLMPMLNTNGILVIMTQRPRDIEAFARWRYILDPTHITFFNEQSFEYTAQHWHIELLELHKDVVVFRKP